jgi:hypothetical protein
MKELIVALDVDTAEQALTLAATLRGVVGGFKVGSRLFTGQGPAFVEDMVARGDRVKTWWPAATGSFSISNSMTSLTPSAGRWRQQHGWGSGWSTSTHLAAWR